MFFVPSSLTVSSFTVFYMNCVGVVEGICTRLYGCPIVNNVCVDCLTVKNYVGLLTGDIVTDIEISTRV